MNRKVHPACRIAFLALFCAAVSTASLADDSLAVHVLTSGPGSHIFTRFGHTALVTEDRQTGIRKVYNFGEFDFRQTNLSLKFVLGQVQYWVALSSYESMVRSHKIANRKLTLQSLNLSPVQTKRLVNQLNHSTRPEKRSYRYNHFTNNCCTKVRDLLNDVTDGAVFRASQRLGRSYRYWVDKYLDGLPLPKHAVSFALGLQADKPQMSWQEQFLPEILSKSLDGIRLDPDGRPLVRERKDLVSGRPSAYPEKTPAGQYSIPAVLVLLMVVCFLPPIFARNRSVSARLLGAGLVCWGLVAGVSGSALVLLFLAKNQSAYYNLNLLAYPVFHLWLVAPGLGLFLRAGLKERIRVFALWYLVCSAVVVLICLALKLGPVKQENGVFCAYALGCDLLALAAIGLFSPPKGKYGV